MTKIIKSRLYCNKCRKYFEVPVLLSTSSFMIDKDPNLKKMYENGTLFKNFCPVCGNELMEKEGE